MSKAKSTKPLPLEDVLRDLAFLRASGVDLGDLVAETDSIQPESNQVVESSRGEAEAEGERVESIRTSLEELRDGMSGKE
ncbi:hypothetical protein AX15_004677 [Amanita polypyramis BW_CC]|nr:hypothetical protein AX15_004677 [Amanita polypyramis BW_CC]